MSTAQPVGALDNRKSRLLQGLAAAVREKGLTGTQVGDVVRNARVSRRTFYEIFPDKESAIVELVREARRSITVELDLAIDRHAPWETQVDQAINTYMAALESDSTLAAMLSRELPTLGERAAAVEREGIDLMSNLLITLTNDDRVRLQGATPIGPDVAVILVGGIFELARRALQDATSLASVGAAAKQVLKQALASV